VQFPSDAQALFVARLLQKSTPTAAGFTSILARESFVNAFREPHRCVFPSHVVILLGAILRVTQVTGLERILLDWYVLAAFSGGYVSEGHGRRMFAGSQITALK
jgi:hypothetical protein